MAFAARRATGWPVGLAVAVLTGCGAAEPPAQSNVAGNRANSSAAGSSAGGAGAGAAAQGAGAGAGGSAAAASASGAGGTAGAAGSTAAGSGGANGASGAGGTAATNGASSAALAELEAHLAMARDNRPAIDEQPFAATPLTRADAERAAELLWSDFAAFVRATRAGEVNATESQAATVQAGGSRLRYYMAVRGDEPPGGRSLFISMHGGGNTAAATNDSQWENQIALVTGYEPEDAIWVAPRAPIDDWNMWFVPEIDPLFERLITNLIVFEGVNPNKVYINGYSAGGDGVYQLGPRMADHWAGAAMSAGHPNSASPLNLRNVAFAIHVGGNDTAYERNLKAAEWGEQLEQLAERDGAGGYPNQWQVHAGLPHWMELEDAVAIPFVQMFARNPVPSKVVWRQAEVTQSRFYWLAVDAENERTATTVTASYSGQSVVLADVTGLQKVALRFSDAMLDLDQPLRIERDGRELFAGTLPRTIAVVARTLEERGDPAMVFPAEISVELE